MAMRYVWPYVFSLRAAGLVEAARHQKVPPVADKYFKSNGQFPVALRWATAPTLGFPREPFQVFRRQRNTIEKSLYKHVSAQVPLNGQQDIGVFVAGDLAYVVLVPLTIGSGSMMAQALDNLSRPIPGQAVTLTTKGTVEFRCPGIAAVRVTGSGTVGAITAVSENGYANLPDWKRIQTVGLPLKKNETGTSYNTLPQGFEPPTLDGVTFSELRTAITALLQVDPPGTGIADFPLPAWPVPNAAAYVANIRSGKSLVPMIERCLTHTVDTDPAKLQADYLETVSLEGIKQASLPGATADPAHPSKAKLPIPGVVGMTVSTDSYAAVALGYGTIDIPPRVPAVADPPSATAVVHIPILPAADNFVGWDYMATAPYTFPFGLSVTLAALATGEPPVQAPVGLAAAVKQVHAPVARNQAAPAVINVSWQPPAIPQGYGVLVSRGPNQSEVLNPSRPAAVKGYDPYVGIAPTIPDPNTPPDQQLPSFSDTACHLPLTNPATNERYLVAGLDVFGQWSSWVLANASLAPAPITKPGVRNAEFLLDPAHATGHVVPATLRIEFAWDWEDRSPGQIRFTGQFVPAGSTLGPTPFLTGFAMSNMGPVGSAAVLTFNYASAAQADTTVPTAIIPTIDGGHTTDGAVQILETTNPNPNSRQVQYRVDIKNFTLDFSAVNEIDFALYVTATESIRPGEFSDVTDPVVKFIGKVAKAFDPIPPDVHFTPPSISWTALPDATGIARGILEWTPDPKASGYYVWEGTESALRHLLDPGAADPAPSTPLVTRGGALKALISANQEKSLQGFARLTKDPVVASRAEIRVPAAASTLYVYRVSAISAAKVESSRSDQVAIFGVPRRNVPGIPRLVLRPSTSPQGIQIIALPVESGPIPAGFRVFRVRKTTLALDGSTMGPAKIDEHNAGWQSYSSVTLAGNSLNGKSIVDTAATPSWFPYHYRILAVGQEDLANGQYAGESGYSAKQEAYVLPPDPPMIGSFAVATNAIAALVTLHTDLPVSSASPLGPSLVALLQMVPDPANPARLTTKKILAAAPETIAVGTLHLPLVLPPPPGPPGPPFPPHPPLLHPPFPHPLPVKPAFARSAPDANGRWTLYVLLPYKAADKDTLMVRLTDPTARRSNHSF